MRWTKIANVIALFLLLSVFGEVSLACVDSDGGRDAYIKGNITYEEGNETVVMADSCSADGVGDDKRLLEYYCNPKGEASSVFIECSNLCSEGRCVSDSDLAEVLACNDSDHGINQYEKGWITGRVDPSSAPGKFSDYCLIGHKDMLMEYYCSKDGLVEVDMIECAGRCSKGSCDSGDEKCEQGYKVRVLLSGKGEASLKDTLQAQPEDYACCMSLSYCEYARKCYAEGSSAVVEGNIVYCEDGVWRDCDSSKDICEGICHLNWSALGEGRFIGEYDREIEDCCGDDPGEHFIAGEDGSAACCDNKEDSVVEGICYKAQNRTFNITALHEKIKCLYDPEDENDSKVYERGHSGNDDRDDLAKKHDAEKNDESALKGSPGSVQNENAGQQGQDENMAQRDRRQPGRKEGQQGQDGNMAQRGFFGNLLYLILNLFN